MAAPPIPWEADVIARDGSVLRVRAIRPSDAPALQDLHLGQSESSRVFRFFAPKGPFTEQELTHFTHVDGRDRVALVVTEPGRDAPLLAVARYDRDGDDAEVAFYVSDGEHGRGLGSLLLDHLAVIGRDNGIARFVADVLPSNGRMLAVFKDVGYTISARMEDGVVGVVLDLEATERSREVAEARERYSEARSMEPVLAPREVVAVPGGILPEETGDVLAVVGGGVDAVPEALAALARAGVGAVVVTAGSGVTDGGWHRAVADAARRHGMRLVGPGSFGVVTEGGINVTREPRLAGGGRLAVFAQSSDSARALAGALVAAGVGVHSFLAAGHRLDVSGNDVMQFLIGRPGVGAAAICLDSIGNPRKFARIARRLAAGVPLVCHIATSTGALAPPGHAVRVSPLPRTVLSSMLRQAGAVEAERREDLVPLARLALAGGLRSDALAVDADGAVRVGDSPPVAAPDRATAERWVRTLRAAPVAAPLLDEPEGVRPGLARRILAAAPDGPAAPDVMAGLLDAYGIAAPTVGVEALEDPLYGPVISVHPEGAPRLVPLAVGVPETMLREAGAGEEGADCLARVARLVEDHPRIALLRIGPAGPEAVLGPVLRPRRARGARSFPSFPAEAD